MADLSRKERSNIVGVTGQDEEFVADVIEDLDGKKKLLVKATVDGVDTTDCNQLEVNESARCDIQATTLTVTKGFPQQVKVGASNLSGRTSVLIQPENGAFKFGFSSTGLHFKVTKGNFFEIKLSDNLNLWVEPINGTKKIAIAEFK